jgi:hypothetical protein
MRTSDVPAAGPVLFTLEMADATSGMSTDPGPSETGVGRHITVSRKCLDATSASRGNAMTEQRHSPSSLMPYGRSMS